MRIPSIKIWLFTAGVANGAATESLNFTQSDFVGIILADGAPTSIFDMSSLGYMQFNWEMTPSVLIKSIYLGIQTTSTIVGENKAFSATGYGRSIQSRDGDIPLQFNASQWPGGGGGSIAFDAEDLQSLVTSHPEEPFFFQICWLGGDDATTAEYTYSQTWGLAHNETEAVTMYRANADLNYGSSSPAQSTSALLSIPTQTTTDTTATSTLPASATDSSDVSSSKFNLPQKYGLLSKGALIGTIIGSVAFIILTVVIAIFCIRRRRSTRNKEGHDRDGQDLMAEKEARAAGIAPDTPYSMESSQTLNRERAASGLHEDIVSMPRVFANEGSQRSSMVHSSLRNVTSIRTGLRGDSGVEDSPTATCPSSSSISLHEPYADLVQEQFDRNGPRTTADPVNPSHDAETEQTLLSPGSIRDETRGRASGSRMETPQLGPSRLARSDTPGGMSISDYLHEDGMTEDEIKRLEEEERALDEAIEQARTDSRAARGR